MPQRRTPVHVEPHGPTVHLQGEGLSHFIKNPDEARRNLERLVTPSSPVTKPDLPDEVFDRLLPIVLKESLLWFWLVQPNRHLGGRKPDDVIRAGGLERVLEAADYDWAQQV